jgi:hypothetical protein
MFSVGFSSKNCLASFIAIEWLFMIEISSDWIKWMVEWGKWLNEVNDWMRWMIEWGEWLNEVDSWMRWIVKWSQWLNEVNDWIRWMIKWGEWLNEVNFDFRCKFGRERYANSNAISDSELRKCSLILSKKFRGIFMKVFKLLALLTIFYSMWLIFERWKWGGFHGLNLDISLAWRFRFGRLKVNDFYSISRSY